MRIRIALTNPSSIRRGGTAAQVGTHEINKMVEKVKNEIRDRKNIFWFLNLGVVISLGLYVYFVSHTVYSAVERQRAEKSAVALESEIEKLETSFLALKARVTADLAQSRGFTNISSVKFISRKSLGKGLSLNNEI